MLTDIRALAMLPGVSGYEDAVREEILARASALADQVYTDACGNVLAFKKGRRRAECRVLLAAHMDEVGLVIAHIEENGFLRFLTAGGIEPYVLPGTRVLVGDARLPGVICARPVHLLKKDEKRMPPKLSELFIYIGADSDEKVRKAGISPGDDAVFDSGFHAFGDGFFASKALDDRAGCALLLELMKSDLEYDTYFAFHTLEEEGLRGAYGTGFAIKPDIAVVVEATTAADISVVSPEKRACALRRGPVLSFLDGRTLYDRELYERAARLADEDGIPWQPKTLVAGGNDAGALQTAGEGVRVLAVSMPCRYLHTASCVMHESDVINTARLLKLICDDFGGIKNA